MDSAANVVVSDTAVSVKQLVPFIDAGHSLYGLAPITMYRLLMKRYIRLKPDAARIINETAGAVIGDNGQVLAVHMPGDFPLGMYPQISAFTKLNLSYHSRLHIARNDVFEFDETIDRHQNVRLLDAAKPQDPYKAFHSEIKKTLGRFSIKRIFLVTDTEDILSEFAAQYGKMLLYSRCERISAADAGRKDRLEMFLNKRSKGIETLIDTYAASQCSFFIGYGGSSLSHAVTHLREWPETNFKLHYWIFKKLYNFSCEFVKTGRSAPEEADGRLRLIVKNTKNSLRRAASVFK